MDALHYVQRTNYKRCQITLGGRHVSMPKLRNPILIGVGLQMHIFVREMDNSSYILKSEELLIAASILSRVSFRQTVNSLHFRDFCHFHLSAGIAFEDIEVNFVANRTFHSIYGHNNNISPCFMLKEYYKVKLLMNSLEDSCNASNCLYIF
jgi:hypothetical protein